MRYIQLVEFDTNHLAAVAADHDRTNHYWEHLEYTSEEEAVRTAELPETKAAYDRWSAFLDGEPTFHNLDVVEQLGAPEGPVNGLGPWDTPRRWLAGARGSDGP
jgi:hypothetical protein